MSKELVISSSRHETRVAILEDDQLVEIYFQRANEYSLAGSIHKGRVTRVLPGMQSAFVDLGLERDTFLYVSDFFEEDGDEFDRIDAKPPKQLSSPVRHEPITITPVIDEPVTVREEIPDVIAAEPVEVEEAEKVEEPALPAGGQDQRDRRGRRGRRRRTRGRGFPDSKYASDLAPSSDSEETAAPVIDEEEPPAAEVFLLPGESLAKYSSRSAEDRERSTTRADEMDAPHLRRLDRRREQRRDPDRGALRSGPN